MVNTKKRFKTALAGVVTQTLAAAVLLSQLSPGAVKAASAPTKFIEKSALGSDTTYGLCTGKTPQKVYFGKNGSKPQGWWIAGYDTTADGLVLVCDPKQYMGYVPFLADYEYDNSDYEYYNKTPYNKDPADINNEKDWECTYSGDAPADGAKVYANHFGGSDIKEKLKELETDTNRFSTAEQDMMKPTTVLTWDMKNKTAENKDMFYSTTSKLYLGAGQYSYKSSYTEEDKQKHYFTVGTNKIETSGGETGNDAVNTGLKVGLTEDTGPVGSPYISGSNWFWVRSPTANSSNYALTATTGVYVDSGSVNSSISCVPACALNLSSVIFASAAAPAAASSSALSEGVYFRVANPALNPKISTKATATGNTLTVEKGSEGGDVYLMVQGNGDGGDWVYSKRLGQPETISMNTIAMACGLSGLSSLENCKVWVETTDAECNLTYAKEIAVNCNIDTVKIIGKCNAVVNLQDKNGAISDVSGITLTLKDSTGATVVGSDGWTTSGATFTSNETITSGSYTLSVAWAGNTLAKSDFTVDVDGTAKTVTLTKLFPCYVKIIDNNGAIIESEGNMSFTLSRGNSNINTTWSYDATRQAFKSNIALAEGNDYTFKVVLGGSALSQPQWTNIAVGNNAVNVCSLAKVHPVYIELKDSLGNKITDADGMTVELQKDGTSTVIPLTYDSNNKRFKPATNIPEGSYTLTVTPPAGAQYTLEQSVSEISVLGTVNKTVIIKKLYPVYIALQDEYGKAITGDDATGITLKIGNTTLSKDATTKGIFKATNIPEGNYTLTVAVDDSSNYLAPEVTTYTINNDADHLSSAAKPCRVIKLKQVVVETGRVVTGVGGDAGYRYDRKTNKTVFYCEPDKGYKVDKIEKDEKGIVKYVSFKIV